VRRSQKCKKCIQGISLFVLLGSAHKKASCKILVKSTPIFVWQNYVRLDPNFLKTCFKTCFLYVKKKSIYFPEMPSMDFWIQNWWFEIAGLDYLQQKVCWCLPGKKAPISNKVYFVHLKVLYNFSEYNFNIIFDRLRSQSYKRILVLSL